MPTFNDLSRQQLESAAQTFGVTVDGRWNDSTLAGKLIEAGVTIDQIEGAKNVLAVDENSALSMFSKDSDPGGNGEPKRAVLKMERPNRSYSVLGYKFTHDHPYVVMPEEDALWIADTVEGFRIAHPTEAAKFYKGN
jgi:hypothetical protein